MPSRQPKKGQDIRMSSIVREIVDNMGRTTTKMG